ncbi:hypothetical protein XENTR_v10021188 [Xenopus tropicalis]|nr:hypothetical protein XENTR_v10021188 [Xenopus tropicalis]
MWENQSTLTYFFIKGISDLPHLQAAIFLVVLSIYLFTLVGNMLILTLVCLDTQLHTPMYFFLAQLSILDMSCSTIALHKELAIYITGDHTVSILTCFAQLYIFSCLECVELLIITAMSYDRFVAICRPLHYPTIMRHSTCANFVILCWLLGFLEVIPYVVLLSNYTCYRSNVINHFFCDLVPLMKLSCNDTTDLEHLMLIEGSFLLSFLPFLLTFTSYVFIILTIMKMRSTNGRCKAFYTCSSHLTVVVLLYVTLICQYLRPSAMDPADFNKLFSLFNTAAVPILNPLIYSLKNKDVKSAFRRKIPAFKI